MVGSGCRVLAKGDGRFGPHVTEHESAQGCGQRDGQHPTNDASHEGGANHDRDDDGQGMHPHTISNDARGNHQAFSHLHQHEDAQGEGWMRPPRVLHHRNDQCRHNAEHDPQVGDNPQDARHKTQ